ncbi:MAG: chitinase [Solirubrobacteraceae bacterium]
MSTDKDGSGCRAPRPARAAMAAVVSACALVGALAAAPAPATAQPVGLAAPYEYLGWGDPQPPATVLRSSGIQSLTLAFVLSRGACQPAWDGARPLLGGPDEAAIKSIRAAGGEVDVSFGGWSGKKLGSSCKTPAALAAAYQKVIDAYSLKAIDVDIEHGEFTSRKTRRRVVEALRAIQSANPGLEISITMGTAESGPEAAGASLIADAAAIGFEPTVWTVMPFDFGPPRTDMGAASVHAVEGLAADLASAYGITPATAYGHAGVSSMNGHTDEASEGVSLSDMQTILSFAAARHLGRLSFWSVNRDRPCGGADTTNDSCSGIAQEPLAFTKLLAEYHG